MITKYSAVVLFKLVHALVVVTCLTIIGVFIYEKNIVTFDNYVEPYAVVPIKLEFDANEVLSFFIFSANDESVNLNVKKILMCDYIDGNGYSFISAQESNIEIDKSDPLLSSIGKSIVSIDESTSQRQTANDLRFNLVGKGKSYDVVTFDGSLPSSSSQCFIKLKFTNYTPNFKIEKHHEALSFHFGYNWHTMPPIRPTAPAREVYNRFEDRD